MEGSPIGLVGEALREHRRKNSFRNGAVFVMLELWNDIL
jgi:hypothetical protein